MKRHYESIHARDQSEDHLAHLIWGFMAVVHVVAIFPHMNDLANYEALRRKHVRSADAETRSLVGDGTANPLASFHCPQRILGGQPRQQIEGYGTGSTFTLSHGHRWFPSRIGATFLR